MFEDIFKGKNFGTTLGGIGALAQAYGAYEMAKNQKKIHEDQMRREDERVKKEEARRNIYQDDIDSAVANVWG
jgi:hypothetical protein